MEVGRIKRAACSGLATQARSTYLEGCSGSRLSRSDWIVQHNQVVHDLDALETKLPVEHKLSSESQPNVLRVRWERIFKFKLPRRRAGRSAENPVHSQG
jgi:hypothetical protein